MCGVMWSPGLEECLGWGWPCPEPGPRWGPGWGTGGRKEYFCRQKMNSYNTVACGVCNITSLNKTPHSELPDAVWCTQVREARPSGVSWASTVVTSISWFFFSPPLFISIFFRFEKVCIFYCVLQWQLSIFSITLWPGAPYRRRGLWIYFIRCIALYFMSLCLNVVCREVLYLIFLKWSSTNKIIIIRWARKLRCLGRPCVTSSSKGGEKHLFISFPDKHLRTVSTKGVKLC